MSEHPELWGLFTPSGELDGVLGGLRPGVGPRTAEDAWKTFTKAKRDREREQSEGWTVRGISRAEYAEMCASRAGASQ